MDFIDIDISKNPQLRPTVLKPLALVEFDVNNPTHCAAYLHFLQEGKWLIKFEVEWPCTTVPTTIERKFALYTATKVVQSHTDHKRALALVAPNLSMIERVQETGRKALLQLTNELGRQGIPLAL